MKIRHILVALAVALSGFSDALPAMAQTVWETIPDPAPLTQADAKGHARQSAADDPDTAHGVAEPLGAELPDHFHHRLDGLATAAP